jgi:hypothetical protein
MALVVFGWFAATDLFIQMSSMDVRDLLYADRLKLIEEDVTPVGVMGNLEPAEKKEGVSVDEAGNVWYEASNPVY